MLKSVDHNCKGLFLDYHFLIKVWWGERSGVPLCPVFAFCRILHLTTERDYLPWYFPPADKALGSLKTEKMMSPHFWIHSVELSVWHMLVLGPTLSVSFRHEPSDCGPASVWSQKVTVMLSGQWNPRGTSKNQRVLKRAGVSSWSITDVFAAGSAEESPTAEARLSRGDSCVK